MSLVFNMVGGSSGGGGGPSASDAILTVTVPTGSTVTATKGSVTLTPTMWVQAADATLDCALFVITPALFDGVNPWTVTATLGTDTASDTVTISENKQYDVELSYSFYLIKNGVLLSGYSCTTSGGTASQQSGYYEVKGTSSPWAFDIKPLNDIEQIYNYVVFTANVSTGSNARWMFGSDGTTYAQDSLGSQSGQITRYINIAPYQGSTWSRLSWWLPSSGNYIRFTSLYFSKAVPST